jgi:hypothetical protein
MATGVRSFQPNGMPVASGVVNRFEIVLGDDALDDAGHLVGAAAGAGRHDELDRAGGLPGRVSRRGKGPKHRSRAHREREKWFPHGRSLPFTLYS